MKLLWLASITACLPAQDFQSTLWPVLERLQCRQCHQDNGVGSTTRLLFPSENSSSAAIREFGDRLALLVQPANPDESLLWRKPTNRVPHGGGERIRQASVDEEILRAWVVYLTKQTPPRASTTRLAAEGSPKPVLRRLTHSQYNHTVRDLLSDYSNPADRFPREDFIHGFTNQAEGQSISPLLAEAYAQAAERLARNAFLGKSSPEPNFIRDFGRRAFRRPLDSSEIARYQKLLAKGGPQMAVEAMLQSPHFLFHMQSGPWGIANKLSYLLWDTMPDQELFRAAAAGELNAPAGIQRQVRRMLDDERARESLDVFLRQWLRFDRLESAIRDRKLFPEFTAELVQSMQEETQLLFRNLVWNGGNFMELFTAPYAFLSSDLAKLYGMDPPAKPWDRVSFPKESGRAGILGQGTFLTLTSKPADTSPTERGLFIREHFLCQQVPPPPAGVNTTLPAVTDEKPLTGRQRLGIHLSNPACAGCHTLIDPIGFGFEKYDAIGRRREKEVITIHPTADELVTRRKTKPTTYELPIEAAGSIRGVHNSDFSNPAELGAVLAREPACRRCVVKQFLRYATGRREDSGDQAAIDAIARRFETSGFHFRELIIAVATSEAFLGNAGVSP
jgi:hypothetical protein